MILASSRRLQLTLVIALAGALGLSILLQAAPSVPSNTWAAAGSMLGVRAGAAAALLPDGRVLVTGGMGAAGVTASVERYSPATNGFVATPSLQGAREYHTATTLRDGRVLVTGGVGADGWGLASAEIYDPVANVWAAAGSMSHPRAGHTATLLRDGSVLVAGGRDNTTPTDTLELFDPESGTFSNLADTLTAPRSEHAAALLLDGRVLITGGFDGTNVLASVDIYNPDDDQVTAGPPMSTVRSAHTATTLLDGRVLVLGGMTLVSEIGMAELYDPAANTFTFAGNSARRQRHSAILLPHNNTVLIVGGYDRDRIAPVETYTPWQTGGTFVVALGPAVGRAWGTATALSVPASDSVRTGPNDGLLLLAGGSASSTGAPPVANADLYGFATVTTDKDDYLRDQVVTVTGGGWQPGESVTLRFEESPVVHVHPTIHATANSTGHISTTAFVVDTHTTGVTFTLTATGTKSEARTTFTDSSNAIRLGMTRTPTPNPVAVGMPFLTRIAVQDISGATVTTSTATITLTSPDGVLTGATPHSATGGIAGFTNLAFLSAPGTYHLLATSPGLQSLQVTVVVVAATPTITLTSSANPSVIGQPVTFTATVTSPGLGTPGGRITFKDGTAVLTTIENISGSATYTTSALSATGSPHSITAVYNGDFSFLDGISAPLSQTVLLMGTTATVTSLSNPSVFGQDVTLLASVSPVSASLGLPTGAVQFRDNGIPLGQPVLLAGNGSSIASGRFHTCAVTPAGSATCWGDNGFGQLGDGSTTDRKTPVQVSGLSSGVRALATGRTHTCALTTAGAVLCWGDNSSGQLGDGSTTNRTTPVPVSGLSGGVQAIAGSTGFTCALTTSGAVKCWGENAIGQLGNGTTQSLSTPTAVSGLVNNVQAIDTGGRHACAVTTGGGVVCWGDNDFGQLGDGTAVKKSTPVAVSGLSSGVAALALGTAHSCVLTTAGGVKCWGANSAGQLGDGTTTNRATPADVFGLSSGVQGIVAASAHVCAVMAAGTVTCWGDNASGAFDGAVEQLLPFPLSGLGGIATAVTTGAGHTCALITSGAVRCRGDNSNGQLGDGTTTDRLTPVSVANLQMAGAGARLGISSLAPGSHDITAQYIGELAFAGSTSPVLTQTVNKIITTTVLTSSPASTASGQTVTFTATVSATGPGPGTPTGTVSFRDGGLEFGTGTLDAQGKATFTTTSLSTGSHTITAAYAGDTNFSTSTSPTLAHTVNQAGTTTTVIAATNPSVFGQSIVFTATVNVASPGSGTPTGTVTFFDGVVTLGTAVLNAARQATFTTTDRSVGSHSITATYAGAVSFATSTSSPLTQTVNAANTTTSVTSSSSSSDYGDAVTFTATVSTASPGSGTPTGSVTFLDGAAAVGVAALNASRQATISISSLTVGQHTITAVYDIDDSNSSFLTSTSAGLKQTVRKIGTWIADMSSSNPSSFGQPVTFTATVGVRSPSPGPPTGTMLFWNGSSALDSVAVSPAGMDAISAGPGHTCTLTIQGQVVCWGWDYTGRFGSPTLSSWPEAVSAFPSIAAVAPGTYQACAVTTAGGAMCWGDNFYGQLGDGTTTYRPTPVAVTGLSSGVQAIAPGDLHTCALTTAGGVQCWGSNQAGQLGNASTADSLTPVAVVGLSSGVSALAAGRIHTCALTAAGGVMCWGGNQSGELGNGSTTFSRTPVAVSGLSSGVQAVAAGDDSTCALTTAGGVKCWGDGTLTPASVAGLSSGVAAIATGTSHCALTTAGAVKCWGQNVFGQLGDGSTTARSIPVAVSGLSSGVAAIAVGGAHACALMTAGGIQCWGQNAGGALGDGTMTDSTTPVPVKLQIASASVTFPALETGDHVLQAEYIGDATYASVYPVWLTQTVKPVSTTTALASSVNPAVYGQTMTFAATVNAVAPGTGTPSGSVTFKAGSTTLGTGTLDESGQATFSTSSLSAGARSITAVYSGDTNFAASTSPAIDQTVHQAGTTTALATSLTPTVFGQAVTFTATVNVVGLGNGSAAGMVTFKQGATALGTGTLDASGQATFSTSLLPTGTASISAVYEGNTDFVGSTSAALTQTVGQAGSTMNMGGPSSSVFGQTVTYIAQVNAVSPGEGTPAGTVTFTNGGIALGTATLDASGRATFSTSSLPVGAALITAVYEGDTNFSSSTLSGGTHTVRQASTSTSLSTSVNPSQFGQALTLTATVMVVSPGAGVPTGMVTFFNGTTVLGTGALDGSNQATLTTALLAAGTNSITAGYTGDTSFAASASALVTEVINKAATTTTLTSSVNPGALGQPVMLTATVSVASGAGAATGIVTLKNGLTTSLGTATLNPSGQATFQLLAPAGTLSITAVYGGDTNVTGSTSPVLTQAITQASTTTSLAASPTPSSYLQAVALTATVNVVAPGAGPADGSVTFKQDGVTLGTESLDGSGQARFVVPPLSVPPLSVGDHVFTATYAGGANFKSSTSPAVTHTVGRASSVTSLTTSKNPTVHGQPVTFTAEILSSVILGEDTVTFKDGGVTLGVAETSGTPHATLTVESLSAGTHAITAVYSGNQFGLPSTSSSLTQTVTVAGSTTTVASSAAVSPVGQPVAFTATVLAVSPSGTAPAGTVQFKDNGVAIGDAVALTPKGAIGAGGAHSCLVTGAGSVRCWGSNASGQLGIGGFTGTDAWKSTPTNVPTLSGGIQEVALGANHSCALTTGGGVLCWGENRFFQTGPMNNGVYTFAPLTVPLPAAVRAMATGENHTCVAMMTGDVKCWGFNDAGQLGDNTQLNRSTPLTVAGLSDVQAVAAGAHHTCALTTAGAVKCWGGNSKGQLGDGTTIPRPTPTAVTGLSSGVRMIEAGGDDTCAVMMTGAVQCWGANGPGPSVTPVEVTGLPGGTRLVSVDGLETCALTNAGAVMCWGGGGALGDGTFTSHSTPVQAIGLSSGGIAISAGAGHACAIVAGGAVKCWGLNSHYEIGDGTTLFRTSPTDVFAPQLRGASASITVSSLPAGSHAITAEYGGEPSVTPSASPALTQTINKIDQTITFDALSSRTYGDADFNVSAAASSGLTVSFAASGGCVATGSLVHITAAAVCTVTASQSGSDSYKPAASVSQSFTIGAATLRAIANDAQRGYWDSLPSLTGTVTGLVNSDPIAVSYTTAAAADSPAGTYAITPTLADPQGRLANYTVQLTPGTLTVLNPAPHLTLADPASAGAGDLELLVTLAGDGFVPQSVVRLGSLTLDTEFVSASSLRAVIPASSLVTAGVRYLTVVNAAPGGGTSSPSAFFVNDTGAPVESTSTGTVTGGTTTIVTGGEAAGTPDTLTAVVSGSGTVTVAQYDGNPTEPTGFSNSGGYFDVFVAPGSALTTLVVTTCDLNGGTSILWYTGTAWQPVQPQAFNAATGCVTMNLASGGTSPTIGQLTGTYFAAVAPEAITPGAIFGSGRIQTGTTHNWFDFSVRERASGADRGRLRIESRTPATGKGKKHVAAQRNRFVTDTLTNVVFSDDAATKPGKKPKVTTDTVVFSGTGRFNGRSGYRFEATAVDRGEPGRNRDSLTIVVRDTAGVIVLTMDDTIDRGNIQSTRLRK